MFKLHLTDILFEQFTGNPDADQVNLLESLDAAEWSTGWRRSQPCVLQLNLHLLTLRRQLYAVELKAGTMLACNEHWLKPSLLVVFEGRGRCQWAKNDIKLKPGDLVRLRSRSQIIAQQDMRFLLLDSG
jgi:hypothetical protein